MGQLRQLIDSALDGQFPAPAMAAEEVMVPASVSLVVGPKGLLDDTADSSGARALTSRPRSPRKSAT